MADEVLLQFQNTDYKLFWWLDLKETYQVKVWEAVLFCLDHAILKIIGWTFKIALHND